MRPPLAASLFLALPAAVAVPAASWDAPWSARLFTLAAFTLLYGWAATRLGLLLGSEIAEIFTRSRRPAGNGRADEPTGGRR